MASIGREGERGELKRIIFRNAAGKQQSLRLGRCSVRAAQGALAGFERVLEAHRVGSTIHPDGVRWLESIDDRLHARVARLGLAQPRAAAVGVTLGGLLDRFTSAATVKPSTAAAYRQSVESLRRHFGEETPLSKITPEHADRWRKATADGGYAAATVAKRTMIAKGIFRRAVRWGLIASSPFDGMRVGAQTNHNRLRYIPRETIQRVLDACPSVEWQAVIGLARFAGLRMPSEVVGLTWADVAWDTGALTVRSPKTAGHGGHGIRTVLT